MIALVILLVLLFAVAPVVAVVLKRDSATASADRTALAEARFEVQQRDDLIAHIRETLWQHREIEASPVASIVLDDIRVFQRDPAGWRRPELG